MSLPQLHDWSGGYGDRHRQGGRRLASWPTRERLRALKRIIPRARVEEVLARTGHDRAHCPRLPGWFMVWFVIALGLFCRDCYRQVFRWLQPFRTRRHPAALHLLRGPQAPGRRPAAPPGRAGHPPAGHARRPRGRSTAGCGPWPSTASSSTCPTPRPTSGPSAAPAAAAPRRPSPRPASWPCARPAAMSSGGR